MARAGKPPKKNGYRVGYNADYQAFLQAWQVQLKKLGVPYDAIVQHFTRAEVQGYMWEAAVGLAWFAMDAKSIWALALETTRIAYEISRKYTPDEISGIVSKFHLWSPPVYNTCGYSGGHLTEAGVTHTVHLTSTTTPPPLQRRRLEPVG